jgi:hypothetical protein
MDSTGLVQSYPAQAVLALVILLGLHILFFLFEYTYRLMQGIDKTETVLMDYTLSSSKSKTFTQDPSDANSKQLYLSDNERTGAEFTYSFFLFVDPTCFGTDDGLLHIFHKGYSFQYPLLGPGVYMHNNKNTMRVYMNTFSTWNSYVDVDDFPVKKWVHVALVCQENGLDVFINGNVAKRLNFQKSVPYQNYQNLYVFNRRRVMIRGTNGKTPSLNDEVFNVFGSIAGLISNLSYHSYALSYTELNGLLQAGPSKKVESDTQDLPPYLTDDWWVSH